MTSVSRSTLTRSRVAMARRYLRSGSDRRGTSIGESQAAAGFSPIQQSESMVRDRSTLPVVRETRSHEATLRAERRPLDQCVGSRRGDR